MGNILGDSKKIGDQQEFSRNGGVNSLFAVINHEFKVSIRITEIWRERNFSGLQRM